MVLDPKIAAMIDQLQSIDSPEVATDDEWKTRTEWEATWGVSRGKAEKLIRDGVRAGMLEHGKRPRRLVNSTVRHVDCYRWVGESGKESGDE